MAAAGYGAEGLQRMEHILDGHAERGAVLGLAYAVARGDEVHVGVAGTLDADGTRPIARDTIFRISSMSKPVAALAALLLVEECGLRLDEPVDPWLPELADRQVLRDPGGPLDDTVAAVRPVTLRDLLTFRLGLGMDFTRFGAQPALDAMFALELGGGPPAPAGPPEPNEWLRRLGTLPLEFQPGERWLYHTSADVLGVLVARAAGQPLEEVLRERLFEPLGMRDTGFSVPAAAMDRFGACFGTDPTTGARTVYDQPDGQWSRPPASPGAGAGLVSTIDDYLAFAMLLRNRGLHGGRRVVSRRAVEAMTTNQLTPAQLTSSSPDPTGATGWGFGLGVTVRRTGLARSVGSYGWDGGLGSLWANDPAEDLVGILMTNEMWDSPVPPPVGQDFWTCVYTALEE